MPFLCCVAYLVFLLHYSAVERAKLQAEQVQNSMRLQLTQAVREIDAQRVERFCENEAANLILSAFAGRARRAGLDFQAKGSLSAVFPVSESDLCVLLSNALENALHTSQPLAAQGQAGGIDVQFYERGQLLFFQITNPCRPEAVHLVKGVPVTDQPGHGLGVQSICSIVAKYGGVTDFSVQGETFVLRLSL